ncbi:hypothetical protein HDE_04335 [Halotydeus destructor]|nr:hypothetical protein HDE_04335 [Halotydeus destructor]
MTELLGDAFELVGALFELLGNLASNMEDNDDLSSEARSEILPYLTLERKTETGEISLKCSIFKPVDVLGRICQRKLEKITKAYLPQVESFLSQVAAIVDVDQMS